MIGFPRSLRLRIRKIANKSGLRTREKIAKIAEQKPIRSYIRSENRNLNKKQIIILCILLNLTKVTLTVD